jgi:hypothetical protein
MIIVFGPLVFRVTHDPLLTLSSDRLLFSQELGQLSTRLAVSMMIVVGTAGFSSRQWKTSRPSESSRRPLTFTFQACLRTGRLSLASILLRKQSIRSKFCLRTAPFLTYRRCRHRFCCKKDRKSRTSRSLRFYSVTRYIPGPDNSVANAPFWHTVGSLC